MTKNFLAFIIFLFPFIFFSDNPVAGLLSENGVVAISKSNHPAPVQERKVEPLPDKIIFMGNMDNVTITRSSGNKMHFNGWSKLKNHPYVQEFVINPMGDVANGFWDIRPDPVNRSKKVMYGQIIQDEPAKGTTRASLSLRFKDEVNLPVYHTRQRMYLHPDLEYFTNYSASIKWFIIFEIWTNHIKEWDGDIAGSARWHLRIDKESGAGQKLFWKMNAEYMQPANLAYNDIWTASNKSVPVPLGKWFTLDMYMKRGEGTDGKLRLTITPDGEPTQELFAVKNSTIYPGRPDIQLKSWQSFKLYLDPKYLEFMKSNNKVIAAYYNDFVWLEN